MDRIRRLAVIRRLATPALLLAGCAAPVAAHVALRTGQGTGLALALALAQAAVLGVLASRLGSAVPARRRARGVLVFGALALALGWGAWQAPGQGLLLSAGLTHALVYATLLAVFAASLLPGRTDIVTGLATRMNPRFHDGMRRYTRRASWAWCGCFAAELAISALLLAAAPRSWWLVFISFLHLPLVLAMAAGEYAVRRRVFPGPQSTDWATMMRGLRGRS